MDPRSEMNPDSSKSSIEPRLVMQDPESAPTASPKAPARPRRPLRAPQVEGSIDSSKPDDPESLDTRLRPHGTPAGARTHMAARTASLPQAPSYRPPLIETGTHPQRALSVGGTADTEPQAVADFR